MRWPPSPRNELDIGAFDAVGVTDWYALQLNIPNSKGVQFDVTVSNVAVARVDSELPLAKPAT